MQLFHENNLNILENYNYKSIEKTRIYHLITFNTICRKIKQTHLWIDTCTHKFVKLIIMKTT